MELDLSGEYSFQGGACGWLSRKRSILVPESYERYADWGIWEGHAFSFKAVFYGESPDIIASMDHFWINEGAFWMVIADPTVCCQQGPRGGDRCSEG